MRLMIRALLPAACVATLACGNAAAQVYAGVSTDFGDGPQSLPGHSHPERAGVDGLREEAIAGGPWWTWERATGDWWGFRDKLADSGLSIAGSYTGEWFTVLDGGVSRTGSVRGLLDVNATLDLEQVVGWKGAQFFADFQWIDGNRLSADVGDIQGVSNIEADDRLQVTELFFEQETHDGTLSFKIGKFDGNSVFDYVDSGAEFINSSPGISPTVFAIPSYPDTAFGLAVSWSPAEWVTLSGGVMDGSATVDGVTTGDLGPATFFNDNKSDDYVWLGELDFAWEGGRAGVGIWHHTGDFTRFSGGTDSGSTGYYAFAEHRVWSPEPGRGVDVFAQWGLSDDEVSEVEWHLGAGIAWIGPFESRADDATGFYASYASLSAPAGFDEDETVFEVFYRFQVTPAMSIKPDLQYVLNPGGDPALDDAVVGGVRIEVAF